MTVKKKLVLAAATSVLGLSLIGGGTYAYFSDTETTANTFAAGTINLEIDKEAIIEVDNMKPGDSFFRGFQLSNPGSLHMKEVILKSEYEVLDDKGDNRGEDFGDHILVEYLYKPLGKETKVERKMLSELNENPIRILNGLPAAHKPVKFTVQFKFIDNGQDQNTFQGDRLKLKWTFKAVQEDGARK